MTFDRGCDAVKKDTSFLLWISICFSCLFLFGVIIGSCFSLTQTLFSFDNVSFGETALLSSETAEVFFDFLFDNIFYLLLIFLFGLTFLGVLIIPGLILLKGIVQGLTFTTMFITESCQTYVQVWVMHLSGVICTVFLFLFAAHAFLLSVKFCKQLCRSVELRVRWTQYSSHFIFTFITFVVSGGIYILVGCLTNNLL